MQKIVFSTGNTNKLKEVQSILGSNYTIITPKDLGILEDIQENAPTLEGNASQKSHYLWDRLNIDCFSDDTGLEVYALDRAPGVHSARYAGENRSSEENMDKLITELKNKTDRTARFRTVISLIQNGKEYQFEGILEGEITETRSGSKGFGYDPIFRPKGYDITLADMSLEEKNRISHRGLAIQKLVDFLR